MVNFLKDVSLDTFIGELPGIINFNNNAIEREFGIFYDSSEGRLKKSVYVPNGTVQSHWGRFTNLEAEYVKFSNRDSLSQALENAKLDHNIFSKKFRNDWIDSSGSTTYDTFDNDFCHDPGVIASGIENNTAVVSLEDRLRVIEASLGISYTTNAESLSVLTYTKPMTKEEEYTKTYQSEPDYYFYTEEYLSEDVYDSVDLMNTNDKYDLQIGQLFNYYSVNGKRYVKVDNSRPIFLYDTPKESTIDILFEQAIDSDDNPITEPFYIILTREKMYTILRLKWVNPEDPDDKSGYANADAVKLQLIRVNENKWAIGPNGYLLPDRNWSIEASLNIYNYKQ